MTQHKWSKQYINNSKKLFNRLVRIYYKQLQANAEKYHDPSIFTAGDNTHSLAIWLDKQIHHADEYCEKHPNN